MFRNYFKIAVRNLWRHRIFSFINILGLSVGMTACFLIFLFVRFELSYDNMHSRADRIYRIICDVKTASETRKFSGPAWAVGPHLMADFPQVEAAGRISGRDLLVTKGNIKFQESGALYADSAFFQMFDFKLVSGDRKTALQEPLSIVFSASAAKKYFGNEDPLGQTVQLGGERLNAKVTGVMQDIPENSQIQADMVLSMKTLAKINPEMKGLDDAWAKYGNSTYVLLKPGTSPGDFLKQAPAFLDRRSGTQMKQLNMYPTLMLEKLRDVYLRSTRFDGNGGNIQNVYIFSLIAVFILLIACLNFINLTTARAVERAKEVGIRKLIGAERKQLIGQFLGESVITCFIAFLITLAIAVLLLPSFNQLAGKTISDGVLSNPGPVAILFAASISIALLAGIYPAFVLSSFKPITVLKGRFSTGTKGIRLRQSLVISQFTPSVILIICTLVVYRQLHYMQERDPGFNKDQVIVINSNGDPAKDALMNEIKALPDVQSVTTSSSVPGTGNPMAYSKIQNAGGEMQEANLDLYFVDFDYLKQFGIKILAGRGFSRGFATDTTQAMILNESAVKLFGYRSPEDAVGRNFDQWGRKGKIIGVIKDFHFMSLQNEIRPLVMRIEPGQCNLIAIKVSANHVQETIASIENKWNALLPSQPFSYFFVDENFASHYASEQRFGKIFLDFGMLAIIMSCLGLLGLASYSTVQRTREIGIRKVLGATVPAIVKLLTKEFLKLVLIAVAVASPVAWLIMHRWLQDFAYRISIGWWIFAVAGFAAALVAAATVGFQAVKAAVSKPVSSLRAD